VSKSSVVGMKSRIATIAALIITLLMMVKSYIIMS
jgi:hypothetical protein